jgi:hypothetical protein
MAYPWEGGTPPKRRAGPPLSPRPNSESLANTLDNRRTYWHTHTPGGESTVRLAMAQKTSTESIPSVLAGVSGEYFVAAELSRRGYIASISLRNTRYGNYINTNILRINLDSFCVDRQPLARKSHGAGAEDNARGRLSTPKRIAPVSRQRS